MSKFRQFCQQDSSSSSTAASSTIGSNRTKSTVPTVPSHGGALKEEEEERPVPFYTDARDSCLTYSSTLPSEEELAAETAPQEQVMERRELFPTTAVPSNPSVFGSLFPSARRLFIRHDDSTLDGNMNLRVDTLVTHMDSYQTQLVTLFHLRMHDLHTRKFSFRRYCRDSGREVCHSSRNVAKVQESKRPPLRRSWSTVLANLRPGSSGHSSTASPQIRPDSRTKTDAEEEDDVPAANRVRRTSPNTMLLEFANYARVDLTRRGTRSSKRYEFEYWSTKYQWRRDSLKDADLRGVSYHLINLDTSKAVAHLVPEVMTPMELVEEEAKGGWIRPCSLWIDDESVYERMPDVAE